MPLIENTTNHSFPPLSEDPFSLKIDGATASLFAELPDAESSFSGTSWSADDEVLDLAPYDPTLFQKDVQPFTFNPSPELVELEAVAAATERMITPMFANASSDVSDEYYDDEEVAAVEQPIIKRAVEASAEIVVPVPAAAAVSDEEMTRQTRHKRKRVATSSAYDDDESDEFAPNGSSSGGGAGTRKSRRTASNGSAAPNRTAAKLAAIRSKTTRVAQTKLKRKAASTLTKSELELAGTLDLSRDELLNMTSDTLEAYAQRLASERPLTAEEQKRFKRQRRLIKNRESAQLSRLRKKAYVDELEKQIADLEDEKDTFKKRCEAQEKELETTRNELAHLRELMAQHPGFAQMAQSSLQNRQRLVQ